MVNFLDGPALGVELPLRRAPFLLRVTRSSLFGDWDALDQVEDVPTANAVITVYRLASVPSRMNITYHTPGGRRRGESLVQATYQHFGVEQPNEHDARCPVCWMRFAFTEMQRTWPSLGDELRAHITNNAARAFQLSKVTEDHRHA
jgi:hypothetical protein